MSKGFSAVYVLVGILVLVGVAGGAYFLGRQTLSLRGPEGSAAILPTSPPTPSVTESTSSADTTIWKTYINNEYQYSLNYPSEWSYQISTKGAGQVMFMPEGVGQLSEPSYIVITVKNSIKQPLIRGDARNVLINKSTVNIAGFDGEQGEFEDFIQRAFSYNDRSYYFNLHTLEHRQIYDQILSTFRFLP